MHPGTPEQAEGPPSKPEEWSILGGVILLFGGFLVSIVGSSMSNESVAKLGGGGALVGAALLLLPLSLRLRLWPFLGVYLAFGIVGVILAPGVVGVICILVTVASLLLLVGLKWRKTGNVKII
jgi:hypothetical protein